LFAVTEGAGDERACFIYDLRFSIFDFQLAIGNRKSKIFRPRSAGTQITTANRKNDIVLIRITNALKLDIGSSGNQDAGYQKIRVSGKTNPSAEFTLSEAEGLGTSLMS